MSTRLRTEIDNQDDRPELDEAKFSVFAEEYVLELEIARAEKNGLKPPTPKNSKGNNGRVHCGFDIESEDRHIEVKSFIRRKTYKDLTARQTEVLIADPLYFVYIVEYNPEAPNHPDVYPIPRQDLISMSAEKMYYRLNGISNKKDRQEWAKLLD